jgi:hypothetical protein
MAREWGLLHLPSPNVPEHYILSSFLKTSFSIAILSTTHLFSPYILSNFIKWRTSLYERRTQLCYNAHRYGEERWGKLVAFLYIWQFFISGPAEIASGFIAISEYAVYLHGNDSYWAVTGPAIVLLLVSLVALSRKVEDIGKVHALTFQSHDLAFFIMSSRVSRSLTIAISSGILR